MDGPDIPLDVKIWSYMDKSAFSEGPWTTEPDEATWRDPTTGLPCIAWRNPMFGNWCGYVGVPRTHPWAGTDLHGPASGISVHGGITFASDDDMIAPGVAARTLDSSLDEYYWFGFDTAHWMDLIPTFARLFTKLPKTTPMPSQYRDLAYVMSACATLAHGLQEAMPP